MESGTCWVNTGLLVTLVTVTRSALLMLLESCGTAPLSGKSLPPRPHCSSRFPAPPPEQPLLLPALNRETGPHVTHVSDQVSRTFILETPAGTCRVQAIGSQGQCGSCVVGFRGDLLLWAQASSFLVGDGGHSPASSIAPQRSLKTAVSCCFQISC